MTRSGALAVCALAVAWFTTACSPAVQGVGGVRLGSDGDLIAVFAWCSGFDLGRAAVYKAESDGRVGDMIIDLKRTGDAPAGSYLEMNVLRPPAGWNVEKSTDLDNAGHYEVRAWNGDGSARLDGFPFDMDELRSPSADGGKILTKSHVGDGKYDSRYVTSREFRDGAEERCKG
jgi:hypothetical protein